MRSGFHAFTRPAAQLEENAVAKNLEAVRTSVEQLESLRERIQIGISEPTMAYL